MQQSADNKISLFQYQDCCKDELNQLANDIANYSLMDPKYLNKVAMTNDIYIKLELFFFAVEEPFDWDELANDPNLVNDIIDNYATHDLARDLFFTILIGIADSAQDRNGGVGLYSSTGEPQSYAVTALINQTFYKLVSDYKTYTTKGKVH